MKSLITLIVVMIVSIPSNQVNASELYKCDRGKKEPTYCLSMVQLLATPEKYHNKLVFVMGFMNLEFEGNSLYLHKEDYDNINVFNSVWLALNDYKKPTFNTCYVFVEGRFVAGKGGHFSMSSGTIVDITEIIRTFPRHIPSK